MEKIVINAIRRSVIGKQVGALRRAGKLPAIMYGHNFEPVAITMDLREATRALMGTTPSSIITINLEGVEHAALIREKQRNYITNTLLHLDFQVVSLTEKIRTMVSIDFVGVAPAIKNYNGVVVNELNELEVEALPQYLPEKFVVDLSKLDNLGDAIYVRDIIIPENVECLNEENEVVVVVTGGTGEITEEEEAGPSEPELIERGKKEEDFED